MADNNIFNGKDLTQLIISGALQKEFENGKLPIPAQPAPAPAEQTVTATTTEPQTKVKPELSGLVAEPGEKRHKLIERIGKEYGKELSHTYSVDRGDKYMPPQEIARVAANFSRDEKFINMDAKLRATPLNSKAYLGLADELKTYTHEKLDKAGLHNPQDRSMAINMLDSSAKALDRRAQAEAGINNNASNQVQTPDRIR